MANSPKTLYPLPSIAHDGETTDRALRARRADMLALPPEEVLQLNVDVLNAVTVVLGMLPGIATLRDRIAALPEIDQGAIDSLEELAWALFATQVQCDIAGAPCLPGFRPPAVAYAEAIELRETLRVDAAALVRRGLLDGALLWSFTGRIGYQNVSRELLAYRSLLRTHWTAITGKSAVTEEDLVRAEEVALELMHELGRRRTAPKEAAALRNRAFTLLLRAYDQTRRAVAFLRWSEDDADAFVPSLHAARGARRKAPADEPARTATPSADASEAVSD